MSIASCKENKVFPAKGTPVKIRLLTDVNLPVVQAEFVNNRVNGTGSYVDFLAGSSGDYWWVYTDKGIGLYHFEEANDI